MENIVTPNVSDVPYKNNNRKLSLFFVIIFVIIIIGGSIVFYYFSSRQSAVVSIETPLTNTSKSTEIKNPLEFFFKNFSAKDYHVRVISKNTESFSFYYEKGVLVRIDGEGTYSKQQSSIIKNGKLYSIDNQSKTFVEMSLDDPRSTYILAIYKVASLLDPILQGETPTATPWFLVPKNSVDKNILEYQTTGRKFISYIPGNTDLIDIKITLDTSTGLIPSISIESSKDKDWSLVNFQYEEVNNIESIKVFPRDYKKVDPI